MVKGNKGEWSEFYAFLKLLADRKLFAADKNLEQIKDKFYLVLKVIRDETKQNRKVYDVTANANSIKIYDGKGNLIDTIESTKVSDKIPRIFERIKNSPDTTFGITLADEAMRDLHCSQIKASCGRKDDIIVMIHDRISPTFPELGFSIKSMLGASSTLLNASGATNFTYEIQGLKISSTKVNSIEGRTKMRDRLKAIGSNSKKIEFLEVDSKNFKRNLKMVDTVLPEIIAEVLKAFYEGKGSTLPELVGALKDNNELKEKFDLNSSDYEFKIKNFLVAVALGMMPNSEWDGFTKAHGGYIVVREDGEIVCYHLYNRDEFQEYLFRNTKFETPSTTRHGYGSIYRDKGKNMIKLNLQIRFIR